MAAVERLHRLLVLRREHPVLGLEPLDQLALRGRHLVEQVLADLVPAPGAGRAAGGDQADRRPALVEHVLHREHPAPGAAEEVHPVEAERVADGVELVHEALRPSTASGRRGCRSCRSRAGRRRRPGGGRPALERLQVVARRARAAVQAQERHAALATLRNQTSRRGRGCRPRRPSRGRRDLHGLVLARHAVEPLAGVVARRRRPRAPPHRRRGRWRRPWSRRGPRPRPRRPSGRTTTPSGEPSSSIGAEVLHGVAHGRMLAHLGLRVHPSQFEAQVPGRERRWVANAKSRRRHRNRGVPVL